LGSDEIVDGNTQALETAGDAQVKIRAVGEERGVGRVRFRKAKQFVVLTIKSGQVSHDLGQTDDGETRGIYDGLDACGLQFRSCTAEKMSRGIEIAQSRNDASGIHIAGRLARGNQKPH
jgi:hypothetical protein